jgi:hypothetical protein
MIVPSAMREQKILHGIHHGLKHISVTTCSSTDGDDRIPFHVSYQLIDAIVRKLKTDWFRIGIDLILKK